MNWKKIETAPKDGTEILVCNENYYHPESACYRTYHPNAQGKKTWRTMVTGTKLNPTHWMPLPNKPADSPNDILFEFERRQFSEPQLKER